MLCNYRQVINFSDFSLSEWNSLLGPTLCNPVGYTVQGISQARKLEWVAISLLWGNLPNLGIEPRSPRLWADSLPAEPNGKPETVVKILQFWGNLMAQMVKRLPTVFKTWVEEVSWRRKWQPTPVFLPGESHGWRSLVGYSPWGRKGSDTNEQLHFTIIY